jgi:hypothetical protein
VVFEIPAGEVALLDTAEGLGKGYCKAGVEVRVGDALISAFVYLASQSHISSDLQPYHWYKGLVAAGARKHRFPDSYLQKIASVRSKPDPKDARRIEMENLLVQLEA